MDITKSRKVISALIITAMIASIFALPIIDDNKTVNAATKKYKVSYKTNGGKFTAQKYAKKATVTKKIKKGKKLGKLLKIKREGYTFKGWYTKKKGGKKVSAKTKIKKKTILYARWTKKPMQPKPPEQKVTELINDKSYSKYVSLIGKSPTEVEAVVGALTFFGWRDTRYDWRKESTGEWFSFYNDTKLYAIDTTAGILWDFSGTLTFAQLNAYFKVEPISHYPGQLTYNVGQLEINVNSEKPVISQETQVTLINYSFVQ